MIIFIEKNLVDTINLDLMIDISIFLKIYKS